MIKAFWEIQGVSLKKEMNIKKAYQDMLKYGYDDVNKAVEECPGRDDAGHQLFAGLAKNAGISEEPKAPYL